MSRVLIIGLDGANQELLVDGINTGRLDTFRRLLDEGGIATLNAPLPPTTPVSMSSILTGRNPAGHGIFSFETRPRDGQAYVGFDNIKAKTLYDILNDAGKDLVSINVPMTTPLPDSGRVVGGFPAHGTAVARPSMLASFCRSIGYRIEPDGIDAGEDAFIDDVFGLAEKRFTVAESLIDTDWELFFLMFTGDARLQHFVDDNAVIAEFYAQVDEYVGRLLEHVEEELTVLVVSDHGFHPVDTVIDLEAVLQEAGFLTAQGEGDWSMLYGNLDAEERYDWDHTVAWPGAAYLGNVFTDAEKTAAAVVEHLHDLRHDGEAVFRDVHRTAELYGDARDGPSIIPVPRRRYNYVAGHSNQVFDEEPEERRAPDREGVILTNDDRVALGERVDAVDILPTLLDLLDVDADGFDGVSRLT